MSDTIPIYLNGVRFDELTVYNWKPNSCSKCKTFSHEDRSWPLNPLQVTTSRNRSQSRPPKPPSKPSASLYKAISTPAPPHPLNPLIELNNTLPSPPPDVLNPTPHINLNQFPVSPPYEAPSFEDVITSNTHSIKQTLSISNPLATIPSSSGASFLGVTTHSAAQSPARNIKNLEVSLVVVLIVEILHGQKINNKKKGKKVIANSMELL